MAENYFTQYETPNKVTESSTPVCKSPSPKRAKITSDTEDQSPNNIDLSFLDDFNIDEIVACLQNTDDVKQYIDICKDVNHTTRDHTELRNQAMSTTKEFLENQIETTAHTGTTINDKTEKIKDFEESDHTQGLDSTLSFKFTECTQSNMKSSDCHSNNDSENYIKVNMNIDIVTDKKINSSTITENNHLYSIESKDKENGADNHVCKPSSIEDNYNTVPLKKIEHTTLCTPKSTILSKKDIFLLNMLDKYLLKYSYKTYSFHSIIHYGKHSKIFRYNSEGEQYAVKMLNGNSAIYIDGGQQVNMLTEIQCDISKENLFCTYLYNSFVIRGKWCFVMEFYPKNLKEVIIQSRTPFNIHKVQDLGRQLVAAVTLLRNNNIIHSDIKPEHILLNCSNDKLKLCGFDKAYYIKSAVISPAIGTLSYRPPEVIIGYSAGFSIDVWTTALVLHEMATGRKLFSGYNNKDILYKQMSTLGSMPMEVIVMSRFGTNYFWGPMFKKRSGVNGNKFETMTHFNKRDKIKRTLLGAYFEHWASSRTEKEQTYDIQKIKSFISLLKQMFILHPKKRLAIEFVFANPFIYNMFDS